MARPTFILAEPEPQEAISTRKLILETAKFNVITAYSSKEMLELVELYPKADAVVLHDSLAGAANAASRLKKRDPGRMLVILASGHGTGIKGADHVISSHEPQALLELVRERFGDPRPEADGGQKKLA